MGIRATFVSMALVLPWATAAQGIEIESPNFELLSHQIGEVPPALYRAISMPPRLEPNKACRIYDGKFKFRIQGIRPSGYIWAFDPASARKMKLAAQKRAMEKRAVEKNTDPCPLILKSTPTPHNPMQRHILARSL